MPPHQSCMLARGGLFKPNATIISQLWYKSCQVSVLVRQGLLAHLRESETSSFHIFPMSELQGLRPKISVPSSIEADSRSSTLTLRDWPGARDWERRQGSKFELQVLFFIPSTTASAGFMCITEREIRLRFDWLHPAFECSRSEQLQTLMTFNLRFHELLNFKINHYLNAKVK